jgi:hypothetical protein
MITSDENIKIRDTQSKLLIISNQISYKLQQFDLKISLDEKNHVIFELRSLLKHLEENVCKYR